MVDMLLGIAISNIWSAKSVARNAGCKWLEANRSYVFALNVARVDTSLRFGKVEGLEIPLGILVFGSLGLAHTIA